MLVMSGDDNLDPYEDLTRSTCNGKFMILLRSASREYAFCPREELRVHLFLRRKAQESRIAFGEENFLWKQPQDACIAFAPTCKVLSSECWPQAAIACEREPAPLLSAIADIVRSSIACSSSGSENTWCVKGRYLQP